MHEPKVKKGDIVRIDNDLFAPKAQVVRVYSEEQRRSNVCGYIEVIYNQNGLKAVKDDLVWSDGE